MKTRFLTAILLLFASLAAAQSDIIPLSKKRSDNTLTAGFDTGGKTVKISATGTLEWVNGATLTGASFFRTAAGLAIGVNVQAYNANTTVLGSSIDLASEITGTLGAGNGGTGQTTLQASVNALLAASGALSRGDIFYFNGTNVVRLAAGTDGYFLKTQGSGADPLWAAVASGLNIGSTAISGGTSGRLLMNSGGFVAELALGTGVSTALGNTVDAASGLLTYGMIGTSGTKLPLLNAANTWSAAQAFTGVLSADPAAGYPQFTATGYTGNGLRVVNDRIDFWISSGVQFTVVSGAVDFGYSAMAWGTNVRLYGNQDDTGRLVLRSGTSQQSFSVANTYTTFTNKEEVELGWSGNVAHLWTIKGSGGGTARDLLLGRDGTTKVTIGATTTDHEQPVKLKSYIVSGLPSASDCGAGSMAFVTDATVTTAYSTVAGGGSNKVLVISDGTNWIIH